MLEIKKITKVYYSITIKKQSERGSLWNFGKHDIVRDEWGIGKRKHGLCLSWSLKKK